MKQSGKLWPAALAAVLAVTVVANVWMLYVASAHDSVVVEPDYYRKAVHWDDTIAQQRVNAELGWLLDARLGAVGAGGVTTLDCWLQDRDGTPLTAARVRVTAIHNLAGRTRPTALLTAVEPGHYRSALPLGHRGLWELRFDVEADRHVPGAAALRFTADLRREAS